MRVADSASIASRIEQAFQSASTSTGTSFEYLVKTAARESSFDPQAKARTSSATGLFQFIESTWLETMKEAGPEHGLAKYADQIEQTSSGKYRVKDPEVRKEILELRKDPEIASVLAGELTQKNAAQLSRKLGRNPTDGELYMAHFLGASGANRLISATQDNADARADKLFPTQARANRSIFYNHNGTPRTASEVYDAIVSKHDAVTMIASLNGATAVPNAKPGEGTRVASADGQPVPAKGMPENLDEATRRVMNAFRATETHNPFEALFRNDAASASAGVDTRFTTAFTATSESRYSSSASSQVAAQELADAERHRPLDLTRFLQFKEDDDQKDLLPPA
ncbi:transglycosylase SLT domain-containing protein [Roseibium aggregatum]|uniref:Transglycosylase SLT domain-containing protein n=1 Tax=Roseibium aggregatum TaxID=187304 RepID=A0A926P267_9HYPH|nr:transglycosylase SLT domain-containing protein [Roseibium aggregatum]MBD1548120.1 transglycosylase SLT domain-containing protein [Roseibium aggregatum]